MKQTKIKEKIRGLIGSVFFFSVFVNLLMLTGPLFMLQVYDRVLSSRSEATLVALFALVGVLYAIMGLVDYARGRLMARVAARVRSNLDEAVFDASLRNSIDPAQRAASGAGLRNLDAIQNFLTAPVATALFDVPWTPLFIAGIFIFHPLLGWLAVAGGGFLIVVALLNSWLTRQNVLKARETASAATGFADEARHSSEIVRSQGMSKAMSMRWSQQQNTALAQSISASDWTGSFTALTKSFRLFLQSAMLAVGAWLVLQNELTAGAMIAGSILLGRALAPIEQSIGQWAVVQQARNGWAETKKLLDAQPDKDEGTVLPVPQAKMSLSNVSVLLPGSAKPTLIGMNFEIAAGEVLGVIGNSGMGKSTLAKTMVGLTKPHTGEVRLGGATLDQYDPDQLGSLIGYLPQTVTHFTGTVAENIARMSVAPDEDRIFEAARKANAHEMILGLPDGYQTVLHGARSQLSGGQQQRIALARALYGDPVMLVLDEPNSALDSLGTDALNYTVRSFKEAGKSVVIMTHRPQAIAECDRLIVLENGRMVANGPRDEVLGAMLKNANDVQRVVQRGKAGG